MGAVVTVGVDVGQKRDPTAIAVVEVNRPDSPRGIRDNDDDEPPYRERPVFRCRFLQRLPLGTPYPEVAARVTEVAAAAASRDDVEEVAAVLIDATGVGQPVVDLLDDNRPWRLRPVYFTYGDRLTSDDTWHGPLTLGKAYLVARLQVLLQDNRLLLPADLAEAEALRRELMDYEIRVTEDANDRYGAFRVGSHDDLVTALGLAALIDPPPPFRIRALFG